VLDVLGELDRCAGELAERSVVRTWQRVLNEAVEALLGVRDRRLFLALSEMPGRIVDLTAERLRD